MASELPSSLDNTLGVLFVGNCAVSVFFGITSIQAITYYRRYPNDTLSLKGLVLFLWILDFLHFAFNAHGLYDHSITNYMKPEALQKITWSGVVVIFLSIHSDTVIRSVFAYRIWKLSNGNIFLLALVIISALAAYASGIALGVRSAQTMITNNFISFRAVIYVCMSSMAVADVVISAALCILLKRSQTVFKQTRSLINQLIIYTINTTVLTSLCAIACVATYAAMPDNLVFQGFYLIIPELYLNSLMATLNARQTFRQQISAEKRERLPLPLSIRREMHLNLDGKEKGSQVIACKVDTITEQNHDRTFDSGYGVATETTVTL